jgi:hypothetical protein
MARMKRADIADEHVLDLASRWRDDPTQPGVVDALLAEGVPRKLALAKVDHMVRRGLLDLGVSPYYAFPA